jgi:hypothetical protein
LDENDPLWYDRAEPDEPPGLWLHASAGVFWVLASSLTVVRFVYRMPDRVWQRGRGGLGDVWQPAFAAFDPRLPR